MAQDAAYQQIAIGSYIAQAAPGATAIVNVYHLAPPKEITPEELAAARQHLAHLPVELIPEPAPYPAFSRMPLLPNPLFVDREAELKSLAATLKGGQTAAIGQVAAATGLGGIGKSQLAAEFVHRYGHYFSGGVFWLSFADPAAIPAEIASCGSSGLPGLGPDYSQLSLERQVQQVAAAWRSPLPRLLVFDNCEEEALLSQWRPQTGGYRVLVTSRRANWSRGLGVQVARLAVLPRPESIALLVKHRPDLAADHPTLAAIAEELGDLPLALHLAGSVLEFYQYDPQLGDPAHFLAELRDARLLEHPALQGQEASQSPTGHLLHVGRTFALSYKQLQPGEPVDALAQQLLGRAACFAWGEPIPRALLLATLAANRLPSFLGKGWARLKNYLWTRPPAERGEGKLAAKAIQRLVALGLLAEEAGGALVLHRLLALFVKEMLPINEAQAVVEETLLAEADRLNEAGYPAPLLAWQPHLRAVTEVAQRRAMSGGRGCAIRWATTCR